MRDRYVDIDEIRKLDHFHTIKCQCGGSIRFHTLQIYAECRECGTKTKVRAFGGAGTEIQDVIDAVLEWAGEGESFEAVMDRRKAILEDS